MKETMMGDRNAQHIPGLDTIRGRYCDGTYTQTGQLTDGLEFDLAIARLRADTLLEIADALEHIPGGRAAHCEWIRNLAAENTEGSRGPGPGA